MPPPPPIAGRLSWSSAFDVIAESSCRCALQQHLMLLRKFDTGPPPPPPSFYPSKLLSLLTRETSFPKTLSRLLGGGDGQRFGRGFYIYIPRRNCVTNRGLLRGSGQPSISFSLSLSLSLSLSPRLCILVSVGDMRGNIPSVGLVSYCMLSEQSNLRTG